MVVIGAGAAGLNAALTLQERGLRVMVLEKSKIANTIEDFPEGKWIYAEPESSRAGKASSGLKGASKEDLLERWHDAVREQSRSMCGRARPLPRSLGGSGHFDIKTAQGRCIRARRVILATGQRGNPRRLGVPGEDRARIYHRLYSPKPLSRAKDCRGGRRQQRGGSGAGAGRCRRNRVTLVHRGAAFERLFKDNRRKLAEAKRPGD